MFQIRIRSAVDPDPGGQKKKKVKKFIFEVLDVLICGLQLLRRLLWRPKDK